MPRHINSAYRALRILRRAVDQNPNLSALDAWVRVFDIKSDDSIDRAFAVTNKLSLLYGEITSAREAMSVGAFSPELYEAAFNNALRAIDPAYLTATWSQFSQRLDPQTLNALAFCSELLPDEENPLGDEDIDSLWARLDELRTDVDKSELPDEVRQFILEQIDIIEAALDNYEITGARAFRRALVDASISYTEHESAVEEHKETPEVKALSGIWGTLARMNERSEIVQKLLTSGVKVGRLIGQVVDTVSKIG
jgi:hypothetical protein